MPAPFLSVLIDDCIARGRDYNAGGARYNTTYLMPVGVGTTTDALSAVEHHVFAEPAVGIGELVAALSSNFADRDDLRGVLWHHTPRYGNDDERADRLLRRLCDILFGIVDGRPNTRGGAWHVNYLSTTCHVYFGAVTGATPDGRRVQVHVSESSRQRQG